MFENDTPEQAGAGDRPQTDKPDPAAQTAPQPKPATPNHPHPKPSVRLKTDGRHFFFAPGSLSH